MRPLAALLALALGCNAPRSRNSAPPPASTRVEPVPAQAPREGLVGGGFHTCLLHRGELRCWGRNDQGQLGDGTRAERAEPALVTGLSEPVRVALGHQHSCALEASGHVACWGANEGAQLGSTPADRTRPTRVPDLEDAIDLAAGRTHTCAVRATGAVVCWGSGANGELGRGGVPGDAREVVGVADAVAIEARQQHTCVRTRGGEVRCWGGHWLTGFFGERRAGVNGRDRPIAIDALAGAEEIAIGAEHVCGRRGGEVTCYGANLYAQLGDPAAACCADTGVAGKVAGVDDAVQIAAGFRHTCARRRGGSVVCWGDGSDRARGPTPVAGLGAVVDLASGDDYTCARRANGEVVCWGDDTFGQLGRGPSARVTRPEPVAGIDDAVELAVGYLHTCARRRGGRVACWGPDPEQATPADVPGLSGSTALGSGIYETCSLPASGPLRCVGRGRGPYEPGEIQAPRGARELVHGGAGICVRTASGEVACVAEHSDAHRMPGSLPARTARDLGALRGARRIAVGERGIPRLVDREVRCVPEELTPTFPSPDARGWAGPHRVPAIDATDVASLALGGHHACARMTSGGVRCWGTNARGQLGDGTTTSRDEPVTVPGLRDVVELTAGSNHTCARLGDGVVACWGDDEWGQVGAGLGERRIQPSPAAVVGLMDAVEIGAGGAQSCARTRAGSVLCWGSNEYDRLGLGRVPRSDAPAIVRGLPK